MWQNPSDTVDSRNPVYLCAKTMFLYLYQTSSLLSPNFERPPPPPLLRAQPRFQGWGTSTNAGRRRRHDTSRRFGDCWRYACQALALRYSDVAELLLRKFSRKFGSSAFRALLDIAGGSTLCMGLFQLGYPLLSTLHCRCLQRGGDFWKCVPSPLHFKLLQCGGNFCKCRRGVCE